MAEQTFRSPGFFEQEIDLSGRTQAVEGVPAGIIGTSKRGPAFVPVTIGTFADFQQTFGGLDPKRFAPYAVEQWLKNRTAVTFTRVLGAGANRTAEDIARTRQYGVAKAAGFIISGSQNAGASYARSQGSVKFLCAVHDAVAQETQGFPVLTDNASIASADAANLVRGMVLLASGTSMFVTGTELGLSSMTPALIAGDTLADDATADASGDFRIILSSSATNFTNDAGKKGGNTQAKIFAASFVPQSENYIGKVLNTDPLKFQQEQHLLYADFLVEDELATTKSKAVAIVSGSATTAAQSAAGGTTGKFEDFFGRFDARYTTPTTTNVTSQPFGKKVYDLFRFETLDDGEFANNRFKISIANIVASTDPSNKFGKFDVQVRAFSDTDLAPQILEVFPECNLDPTSDRYIAAVVGDKKVVFDHDAQIAEERRLVITGKYANVSRFIRVLPETGVQDGDVPNDALPFGFRGIPVVKTSDTMTDTKAALAFDGRTLGVESAFRLHGVVSETKATAAANGLTGSIVPPLPLRYKVTRGATLGTGYEGNPGADERTDGRFYWGVKFEKMAHTESLGTPVLNPNVSSTPNPLVAAYTKLTGISKLDMSVTGSGADAFNNNAFTLSRVAVGPDTDNGTPATPPTKFAEITGSAKAHMLSSVYVRNGTLKSNVVDSVTQQYVVDTSLNSNRVTLATLLASSSVVFNRFTPFAKFTIPFHGGTDGFNLLDPDAGFGNDRSTSQDAGGLAGSTADIGLRATSYIADAPGESTNAMGIGFNNNSISSFRTAAEINTDPFAVRINLLAIPGIKDAAVSDFASERMRDYSQGLYVMDIPEFGMKDGTTSTRLFDDSTLRADVLETAEQFAGRALDNSFVTSYFPSVIIEDSQNKRRVKVPPSIAALAAFGFNDRVAYPWFAPAGFNRGALEFVKNTSTRLTQADRDTLYENRINPIANFPTGGFVIFGQKTLQQTSSALDRVNVRRMLLEVKRIISQVARNLLFEQNNATTRNRFVSQTTPLLALIQAQQGIESFQVVMDNTNNTELDREQNRLNGRIVVVPTRAIEFVAIDFIITNAGVSFE
ncbi:MAG: hypothetical protein CMA72_09310 [Euryarchaeota archaeon]|nr:hypothetical protein [Euryarchaeota archaeon]|tara:strand:+ start:4078 stop:7287 length:3210 start_codon:yes stop_codon:yes gene_type:complete